MEAVSDAKGGEGKGEEEEDRQSLLFFYNRYVHTKTAILPHDHHKNPEETISKKTMILLTHTCEGETTTPSNPR